MASLPPTGAIDPFHWNPIGPHVVEQIGFIVRHRAVGDDPLKLRFDHLAKRRFPRGINNHIGLQPVVLTILSIDEHDVAVARRDAEPQQVVAAFFRKNQACFRGEGAQNCRDRHRLRISGTALAYQHRAGLRKGVCLAKPANTVGMVAIRWTSPAATSIRTADLGG